MISSLMRQWGKEKVTVSLCIKAALLLRRREDESWRKKNRKRKRQTPYLGTDFRGREGKTEREIIRERIKIER